MAVENLDGEIWVPIYRGYRISNMGRIVTEKMRKHRVMITYPNNRGYHIIHIRIAGRRIAKTVHRLVAMIFLKNTDPSKVTVNHNFGKDDNRASSLNWMTYSENSRHGVETGLLKTGSLHYKSSLDSTQVKTIKSLIEDSNLTNREIGSYFKVSYDTIGRIRRKQAYLHQI